MAQENPGSKRSRASFCGQTSFFTIYGGYSGRATGECYSQLHAFAQKQAYTLSGGGW